VNVAAGALRLPLEVGVLGAQATGFGAHIAAGATAVDRYAALLQVIVAR
jgi:hypothetical protein